MTSLAFAPGGRASATAGRDGTVRLWAPSTASQLRRVGETPGHRLARHRYRPGEWCGGNDPKQCGDYTVGRLTLGRMLVPPERAVGEVVKATSLSVPN